jgi:uncharacterized membrane protein YhaH (DUF805 family)
MLDGLNGGVVMGVGHYLFSFSGRANRAKQWALLIVGLVFSIVYGVVFGVTGAGAALAEAVQNKTMAAFFHSPQLHSFLLVCCVLVLVMYYIVLAVTTKRLHDRNKSAWWLLVFYVLPIVLNIPTYMMLPQYLHMMQEAMVAAQNNLPPPQQPPQSALATIGNGAATIITLWAFVELYCLPGTSGSNRYGPDPLARPI